MSAVLLYGTNCSCSIWHKCQLFSYMAQMSAVLLYGTNVSCSPIWHKWQLFSYMAQMPAVLLYVINIPFVLTKVIAPLILGAQKTAQFFLNFNLEENIAIPLFCEVNVHSPLTMSSISFNTILTLCVLNFKPCQ